MVSKAWVEPAVGPVDRWTLGALLDALPGAPVGAGGTGGTGPGGLPWSAVMNAGPVDPVADPPNSVGGDGVVGADSVTDIDGMGGPSPLRRPMVGGFTGLGAPRAEASPVERCAGEGGCNPTGLLEAVPDIGEDGVSEDGVSGGGAAEGGVMPGLVPVAGGSLGEGDVGELGCPSAASVGCADARFCETVGTDRDGGGAADPPTGPALGWIGTGAGASPGIGRATDRAVIDGEPVVPIGSESDAVRWTAAVPALTGFTGSRPELGGLPSGEAVRSRTTGPGGAVVRAGVTVGAG